MHMWTWTHHVANPGTSVAVHTQNWICLCISQVPILWRGSLLKSLSSTLLTSWSLKQGHQEDINSMTGREMETHLVVQASLWHHRSFQTLLRSLFVSPPPRMIWECMMQTSLLHLGKHKYQIWIFLSQDIVRAIIKVGISGYSNLRTMSMDKWVTSKSTQLSTKFGPNSCFRLKMP